MFGKSRATRCQNSSLLRLLATAKTSKKRFRKNLVFFNLGNQFYLLIFQGHGRYHTMFERPWAVCSKGLRSGRIRTIVITDHRCWSCCCFCCCFCCMYLLRRSRGALRAPVEVGDFIRAAETGPNSSNSCSSPSSSRDILEISLKKFSPM